MRPKVVHIAQGGQFLSAYCRAAMLPSRAMMSILLALVGCTAAAPPGAAAPSWPCANTFEAPGPDAVVPMEGKYELFVASRKLPTTARPVTSGYLTLRARDSVHGYARDATGRRLTSGTLPDYPFAGTGTVPASTFRITHFSIPLSSADTIYPGVLVERAPGTGRVTILLGTANLLDGSGAFLDLGQASHAGDTLVGTWSGSPGGQSGVFCAIRVGP